MATKHTPGPWRIIYNVNVVAAENRGISNCGSYSDNRRDPEEMEAENAANARLIAAAPELLAACKAMASMINGSSPFGSDKPEVLAAIAAIAKAEGDSK